MLEHRLSAALADITRRSVRDPRRLRALQSLCKREIAAAGGPPSAIEAAVAGHYRTKRWDVASLSGCPTLAVSARASVTSRANNAHQRVEELLAEAVNVHRSDPEAVLGFLNVIAVDRPARTGARSSVWSEQRLAEAVAAQCGRRDADDLPELFELGCVLCCDFQTMAVWSLTAPGLCSFSSFCEALVAIWRLRSSTGGSARAAHGLADGPSGTSGTSG